MLRVQVQGFVFDSSPPVFRGGFRRGGEGYDGRSSTRRAHVLLDRVSRVIGFRGTFQVYWVGIYKGFYRVVLTVSSAVHGFLQLVSAQASTFHHSPVSGSWPQVPWS